jgi:hypothetical protein
MMVPGSNTPKTDPGLLPLIGLALVLFAGFLAGIPGL